MRKIAQWMAVLGIMIFLTGCAGQQAAETDMKPQEIAAAIVEGQSELPPLEQVAFGEEMFSVWLSDYYGVEAEKTEDGVICYADGVEASEIAVLKLTDEKNGKEVEAALKEYMQKRAEVFAGYAPQQAAMAENGMVVVEGRYIALLICQEPSAAKTAFLTCFSETSIQRTEEQAGAETEQQTEAQAKEKKEEGEETKEQAEVPVLEQVYDSDAILQAWKSGDDSSLSELNRTILDAAKAVISQEIRDEMSDYEKELAIHDWITGWSSFDYGVFGRSAAEGFEPGSDIPYGVLIDRQAMCHGYSSTFQLFMDMLDIECITVFGIPGSNGTAHSWNMVKLDGEWYCVDVAWDDPIGGTPGHRFFNVTSEYMRKSGIHKWDETAVPEAVATAYSFKK